MRKTIKTILSQSRILWPLKVFQQNHIIIFNYHRIRGNNLNNVFDDSVFGPDAIRFRQEMEWLKKETRILSEDELIDIVYNNKKIKDVCSMVTFDDGYRDNFDIAYPILRDLKIPATFFIPTHQLSTRQVGWWDIVAYLVKQTVLKSFTFQNIDYAITDKNKLIKHFNNQIKVLDSNLVKEFLIELSNSLKVEFPSIELQTKELMTWEQVKLVSNNGISIGSHSHDHSILSRQSQETLTTQLSKSIAILESKIDKKIKSIAYPVGGYQHFNQLTKDVSKQLGFKLGFSFLTGINSKDEIDPFNVKRMSIRPEWENLDMALAFPKVFLQETVH
jgi:peptidoglycan/xylan/chitin deacetylase (PgdA/CDA1 family)